MSWHLRRKAQNAYGQTFRRESRRVTTMSGALLILSDSLLSLSDSLLRTIIVSNIA